MKKSLSGKILRYVCTGLVSTGVLAGCQGRFPAANGGDKIKYEVNGRIGWTPVYSDLKLRESKEVPVHPDDAGFLHGSTKVNASGKSWDVVVLKMGVEGVVGTELLSLVGGIDAEVDGGGAGDQRETGYMYDFKKQASDTRPEGSGSYVYDKVQPGVFSPVPFIGLRAHLENTVELEFELAFPQKTFTRTWGNHRFNQEEAVGREEYSCMGSRISVGVGYRESEKEPFIGVKFLKESFELGNAGTVDNYGVLAYLTADF